MVEQVHREPDILLYHNIVSGQELRDIQQAAGPLVGSDCCRAAVHGGVAVGAVPGDGDTERQF